MVPLPASNHLLKAQVLFISELIVHDVAAVDVALGEMQMPDGVIVILEGQVGT